MRNTAIRLTAVRIIGPRLMAVRLTAVWIAAAPTAVSRIAAKRIGVTWTGVARIAARWIAASRARATRIGTTRIAAMSFAILAALLLCNARVPAQLPPGAGTAMDVDINGILTLVDSRSSMLRQFSSTGKFLREVGGQGWGNDQFDRPSGVWARNGLDIFVADYGNHRIQRFDKNLAFVSSFSTRESDNPAERFGYPTDVAVSRLGELYICDSENARIIKVGPSNRVDRTFGDYGAGTGRLLKPVMVKCGPDDAIFVLDPPRVLMFDTFGNWLGELGPGMFREPASIAADQYGVAVLDSAQVLYFPAGLHRGEAIPIPEPKGSGTFSCALGNDSLYIMGPSGLAVLPVPAPGER